MITLDFNNETDLRVILEQQVPKEHADILIEFQNESQDLIKAVRKLYETFLSINPKQDPIKTIENFMAKWIREKQIAPIYKKYCDFIKANGINKKTPLAINDFNKKITSKGMDTALKRFTIIEEMGVKKGSKIKEKPASNNVRSGEVSRNNWSIRTPIIWTITGFTADCQVAVKRKNGRPINIKTLKHYEVIEI